MNGKWRALIRRKDHKSISKRFPTLAAAEAWAREIEGQIDQGLTGQVLTKVTVADLISTYRGLQYRTRPTSDYSNEHDVQKSLAADLGAIRAAALSVDDWMGFATKPHDDGAGTGGKRHAQWPQACRRRSQVLRKNSVGVAPFTGDRAAHHSDGDDARRHQQHPGGTLGA